MTPGTLPDFERRLGLRVAASPPSSDATADRFVVLTEAPPAHALAVVYDLSDSATSTARTAARLPGLLRGWDRAMPVWTYALSDASPLADCAGTTVGELVDGSADLKHVFADNARLSRYRRRGSFITPTLVALRDRMSVEAIDQLRVIVVSDGQLTDFEPAPVIAADIVCLMESDEDTGTRRSAWHRVMATAPVHAVAEPAVDHWFSSRQRPKTAGRQLRLRGVGVRHSALAPSEQTIGDWLTWSPSDGPLFVRVPAATWPSFGIDGRSGEESLVATADAVAAARPLTETQSAGAKAAVPAAAALDANVLFDSLAAPAELEAAWHFATGAFVAAAAKKRWPTTTPMHVSAQEKRLCAIMCVCNRVPHGRTSPGDRVVILGVAAPSRRVEYRAGDTLVIGTLSDAYAIGHDHYEDRWYVVTRGPTGEQAQRSELHPTASDTLPDLRTTDGQSWPACFTSHLDS